MEEAIKKKTDQEIQESKQKALMNMIARRASYYRANPQRFVDEFLCLGIKLRPFQKILLWAMCNNDHFYFVAARSLGKTYLVALYAVIRCILWPGSQVVVASYTWSQAALSMKKITDDFMHKSPILCNEIKTVLTSRDNAGIYFKNGSYIRPAVAGEGARGLRSNLLIIDESRLVPQKIIDEILGKTKGTPRMPGYVNKPEYAHLQETNKEIYMSSAYYAASEMFDKVKSFSALSLNPDFKYFACALPYQLSIKEGILMKQEIIDEMNEQTFNEISFLMEREALFFGSSADALFDFKIINNRRILAEGLRPLSYYQISGNNIPDPVNGERRILSVDVALMASKKHDNDASALIVHSAIPTANNSYIDNIIFVDSAEGLTTQELSLLVMRYYYQYKCDFIAIDAIGVGQGVLDLIMEDKYDPLYGMTYGALNVYNRPEYQERCKVKSAPKVIYAIKATSKDNNDMCLALRTGFQNGYINLLVDESGVGTEDKITKVKGHTKLSDEEKAKLLMPHVQTTLLINELVNLDHEVSGGLIKVHEKSGARKDRYSSLMYGYSVVQELGRKLKPKDTGQDMVDRLAKAMRKSSMTGRTANMMVRR